MLDINIWQGDTNDFVIDKGKLRLNASTNKSRSILYSHFENIPVEAQWNIDIILDFNPSGQNNLKLWLFSDSSDPRGANGYYISIGENGGDDAILIYQRQGGEDVLIAAGQAGRVAEKPNLSLKLKRGKDNVIMLNALYANGFEEKFSFVAEVIPSGYFILDCNYSSSRADKFFFDNFYIGPIIVDNIAPTLKSFTVSENSIVLVFSEALVKSNTNPSHFDFFPAFNIENVISPQPDKLEIIGVDPFATGIDYSLDLIDLSDIEGNALDTFINFSLASFAALEDIVINEILFNPRGSGSDYVEIVNKTNQVLSLQNIYLSNQENGQQEKILTPSQIMPGEFLVFTKNKENITSEYPLHGASNIYEQGIPSYNNDNGNVSIRVEINGKLKTIDSYNYSEKDHFLLLDEEDGVSLERIDINGDTNDKTNWTSAASSIGFGTPGIENSTTSLSSLMAEYITVTNKVFSPNGDGIDDKAEIRYELPSSFVANAVIYDITGRKVYTLLKNTTIPTKGRLLWTGIGSKGEIVTTGIYVLVLELFDLDGRVIRHKEELVIARR